MVFKKACLIIASVFVLLGCENEVTAEQIPIRVLPDGVAYCTQELNISFGPATEMASGTIARIKAFTRFLGSVDGELIYYNWRDEDRIIVLYERPCDEVSVTIGDFSSNLASNFQISLSNLVSNDHSPTVYYESDRHKFATISDAYDSYSKYELDQCTVRLDLKNQAKEHSHKVDEIFAIGRAITNGRVNFAFPIFFSSTADDFSAYVLFWEHCADKKQLMEKILLNLEKEDSQIDFSNILVREWTIIDDINNAFSIKTD